MPFDQPFAGPLLRLRADLVLVSLVRVFLFELAQDVQTGLLVRLQHVFCNYLCDSSFWEHIKPSATLTSALRHRFEQKQTFFGTLFSHHLSQAADFLR